MSNKCRAFSKSRLGLEPVDNRKAFYAGWDAALNIENAKNYLATHGYTSTKENLAELEDSQLKSIEGVNN